VCWMTERMEQIKARVESRSVGLPVTLSGAEWDVLIAEAERAEYTKKENDGLRQKVKQMEAAEDHGIEQLQKAEEKVAELEREVGLLLDCAMVASLVSREIK